MTASEVVIAFWKSMALNDFFKAGEWLSDDFECFWPQSNELIVGRENYAQINTNYPAAGQWQFTVNSVICDGAQVVTDVDVTDGEIKAKAITFHTVENNRIRKQVEYWPDSFAAPEWRRQWVKMVSR